MTISAVVDFLEASGSDNALRDELARTLGVGDGDVSGASELDENETAALLGAAGAEVCSLAARKGYDFTVSELRAVVGAFQSLRAGEISEEQLLSMLGLPSMPSMVAQETAIRTYRGVIHTKATADGSDKKRRLDVVRFVEATASDDAIRAELQSILQAGDGDISDFSHLDDRELQALKSSRGAIVADFAAKHGYTFTIADLYSIVDAFQRMKAGELSKEAFEKFIDTSSQTSAFLPFIDSIATMTYKGFQYDRVKPTIAHGNSLEVVRFIQKSHDDEELRSKLQQLIGGDGDISSPEQLDRSEALNLIGERSAQVVALAASEGFKFTISDLSTVVGAFQLVEKGELSLESCKRILGIDSLTKDENLGAVGTTMTRIYRGIPVAAS